MERQEKNYYTNVLSYCVTSSGDGVITQGKGAWIYDRGPPLLLLSLYYISLVFPSKPFHSVDLFKP